MFKSGTRTADIIWSGLTWLALGLGTAGALLPLLPTTPFLLLALWTGSRALPRLRFRLYRHPRLGPALISWHRNGALPARAKWLACLMMASSLVVLWLIGTGTVILSLTALILIGVSAFVLTRPSAGDHPRVSRPCQTLR